MIKYKGDGEQSLQFSDQDLVDSKGNLYKSFNAVPPNDPTGTLHVPQAVKDIDYGFVTTFENIAEKLPNISLLTIRLFGNGAAGIPFNFKGVQVQW
ncbi:hypothetical protein ACFX5U_20385 [Sphingobacterium sp. SG20118]|uniref:hypothetical protein n=1 Tax=Sphingobacterium sp. SG20118 TaxID=3367156 RepID=UPI0037DFC1FF